MADVHDRKTRRFNMSRIRGKDSQAEILVRRFIHGHGFRYSLHNASLKGKPDIVLNKHKTIIDVRGCFWHSHEGCEYGEKVSTDSEIISSRRLSAVQRDKDNEKDWRSLGWTVITIWAECELEPRKKKSMKRNKSLEELLGRLTP